MIHINFIYEDFYVKILATIKTNKECYSAISLTKLNTFCIENFIETMIIKICLLIFEYSQKIQYKRNCRFIFRNRVLFL